MSGKENDPNAADPEVYECRIYGLLPYIPKITWKRGGTREGGDEWRWVSLILTIQKI